MNKVRIQTQPGIKKFRRAGIDFSRTPKRYSVEELGDKLDVLKDEKMLIVNEIESEEEEKCFDKIDNEVKQKADPVFTKKKKAAKKRVTKITSG